MQNYILVNAKKNIFLWLTPPSNNELEFHIKTLDGGEVSDYVKNTLEVGETIKVKGPFGNAYLRDRP